MGWESSLEGMVWKGYSGMKAIKEAKDGKVRKDPNVEFPII